MEPLPIASMNSMLVHVSRELREHGWALICSESGGHPFQFTLGLTLSFGHPEIETIGLTPDWGQSLLERLVNFIKGGRCLRAGEFLSDLLPGHDLFLVENPIDPEGPPLTGGRLRLIWPDGKGRFPWHPDCEPYCATQARLLEPDGMTMEGLELLLANSRPLVRASGNPERTENTENPENPVSRKTR